jgi:hypothetical protein
MQLLDLKKQLNSKNKLLREGFEWLVIVVSYM